MSHLQQVFARILIRLFVDNIALHKYWGCHRLSERSFFVQGRQFHVCARCTGLISGASLSVALIPVRDSLPVVFFALFFALAIDGLTQLVGWRTSNNGLRFITGFGVSLAFIPSLISIGGY